MKKLILLIIFIISTSYVAPKELEYTEERQEIQQNIDEANKNLNEISVASSDEKRLKQIQKKLKKDKQDGNNKKI